MNLPIAVPVGKAETVIIIQPLNNGRKRKGEFDLAARGITPEQAANMHNHVISFEEDWNAPMLQEWRAHNE